MKKNCIKCNLIKEVTEFETDKRGTRNVCIECRRNSRRIVNNLKKTATEKPEKCQCCGKEEKLVLDHCYKTKKFRGWVCNQCNIAIGNLGDNLSGVMNAVLYLTEFHESN